MTSGTPIVIADEQALVSFRQGLTGAYALGLLAQARGRLLVQLAVGVGKSAWLVQIVRHALRGDGTYDLVIVLVPRWDILRELQQRLGPLPQPPTVLTPRPRQQCGALDAAWVQLEQTGCGALGREQLCSGCPIRPRCRWPQQYGAALQGVRLVLATQQHLVLNPGFVAHLQQQTGARRPLLLLDESDLLLRCQERSIARPDLERFLAAQQEVLDRTTSPVHAWQTWHEQSEQLLAASTEELAATTWHFPRFQREWAVQVQQSGRLLHGDQFRFLGHDLQQLAASDRSSREVLATGAVRFAVRPSLGQDFIIFSGSIAGELARYRLDPDHRQAALLSPFADHRFIHPRTRWYNLALHAGAARYFPSNAPRLLDFFAEKIAQNIRAGKRTLLVARKKFRRLCRSYLRERLRELGLGKVRIVCDRFDNANLDDPAVLPLISYGISGVNRFEHFDAAYCLTSYYVSAATISQAVQDIDASAARFPIQLDCRGVPPQRRAVVVLPDERETILPQIAQGALVQKEADVVVQAVGRVRPFTRPREVITFQMGDLPGVAYTANFTSLADVRAYFQVLPRREREQVNRIERAWQLKSLGLTNAAIADALQVSLATAKRYLKVRKSATASNSDG